MDNGQACTYAYDALGRIGGSATSPGVNCVNSLSQQVWQQFFTYDPFGNVRKTGSSSWTPNYNEYGNQYDVGGGISYDANGDLLSDTFNTYSWDPNWGNLATVNGQALVFDSLGRMVENSSTGTEYVYAPGGGSQVFATMNGQHLVQAQYPLPAGGMAIYQGTTLTYYAHPDWQGSGRLVTHSSTQSMAYDSSYAPFGEQYSGGGSFSFYDFTGQQQWTTSGLDDFLFRRYHPVQGRWISPDPAGLAAVDITNPQTWNRYAYVGNNPLSNVDPLGLNWIDGNGGCDYTGDSNCDDSSGPDCGIGICPIFPPIPCCGGDPGPSPNPTPAPTPAPQQPINFPNETLGLPNGFPTNPWGVWGAIIPTAQCGDITCPSIGSGFGPEEGVAGWVICQFAEPCGGIVDAVIVGGLVLDAGLVTYQYFSKKADLKTAEAARNRVAQICGKPIDRRKFHDLVTGQGLDYQEMVTEGVSWFCPEKAGKN